MIIKYNTCLQTSVDTSKIYILVMKHVASTTDRQTEVSNTLQSRCHNILTDDLCPLLTVDDKFCQIIKRV